MRIENYKPEYSNQIADIYNNTIRLIASADYTQEELNVWAPTPIEYDKWVKRLEKKQPFVAIDDGKVVGFGELESGGHIDCFYVHHSHQRVGDNDGQSDQHHMLGTGNIDLMKVIKFYKDLKFTGPFTLELFPHDNILAGRKKFQDIWNA